MPDHPLAIRAREQFRSIWEEGDPVSAFDALADDVAWRNDIGAGPLRVVEGKDEVIAMFIWWTDFFEGTFRHELIDVCASDEHVVQILRELGTKDGNQFDNLALYLYEVDHRDPDRFSKVHTFDRDRDNIEAFWSHYPDIAHASKESLLSTHLPS